MVSILSNKSLCPSTLTDHVHRLISLISSKHIRVVPGTKACVDKNHTVYLPPLPDGASEKDFIKYFHLGTHEQSHIESGSEFDRFSKDKIKFKLENALEDIRCEQLQEKGLQGLVPYRIRFYQDALNDFANKEMSEATTENIIPFISVLGKYLIIRIRKVQLHADHLTVKASPELIEAYHKHVSDLDQRIINMKTSDEMFELSGIIYDRLKDIIRKQIEKQQQGSNNEKDSQEKSRSESSSDEDTSSSSNGNDETDEDKSSGGNPSEKNDYPEDNGDPEHDESSPSDNHTTNDGSDDNDNGDSEDNKPVEGDDNDDNNNNKNRGDGSDPSEDNIPDPEYSDDQNDDDRKPSNDSGTPKNIPDPEEIEKELQRIINDLNSSDDPMDITTEITQQINNQDTTLQPYMVSPDVKDIIDLGKETTNDNAAKIRKIGLEILGPKGSQITKLFVSQSYTRTAYNQYSGTIDALSYVSDVHDIRDDVHRTVTGPRLDKAAVTFLIDNSSSMSNTIGYIYAILSGLLHYLSRANIPTEAIGYTVEPCSSDLWRNVAAHLTIVKKFNEPFSGAAMRRCVPPPTMLYTNDLDGIKFAVPRIWARPERKKVIMILCDGEPYTGNIILNQKLQRSYIEYINLCRKAGIIIFGIGINKNLSKYFGEDFASVNLQDVGSILVSRLTKILNRVRA